MKKNVIRSLEKIYLGHLFFSKIVDRITIGRNNQAGTTLPPPVRI